MPFSSKQEGVSRTLMIGCRIIMEVLKTKVIREALLQQVMKMGCLQGQYLIKTTSWTHRKYKDFKRKTADVTSWKKWSLLVWCSTSLRTSPIMCPQRTVEMRKEASGLIHLHAVLKITSSREFVLAKVQPKLMIKLSKMLEECWQWKQCQIVREMPGKSSTRGSS